MKSGNGKRKTRDLKLSWPSSPDIDYDKLFTFYGRRENKKLFNGTIVPLTAQDRIDNFCTYLGGYKWKENKTNTCWLTKLPIALLVIIANFIPYTPSFLKFRITCRMSWIACNQADLHWKFWMSVRGYDKGVVSLPLDIRSLQDEITGHSVFDLSLYAPFQAVMAICCQRRRLKNEAALHENLQQQLEFKRKLQQYERQRVALLNAREELLKLEISFKLDKK